MATTRQKKLMAVPNRRDTLAAPHEVRNPGTPLDLDWVADARVNRSAVERRAATLGTRRTVKKEWQAAWLLRAITLMDLTTLAGDDTPGNVRRLCAKARQPVREDILDELDAGHLPIRTAAVCVYHALVPTAVEALRGSGIPVAAVSTGFPAGLSPFKQRVEEIRASVEATREELRYSLVDLQGKMNELSDWRASLRRNRRAAIIGAAAAGFLIGGGVAATIGLFRR